MANLDRHQLLPLLREALAGDACAWNDFFGHIRRYVAAEVHKTLGAGADGHSDVVQSVLRRVWEGIGDQFAGGAEEEALRRFLALVSTIARNRSIDNFRWRKTQRKHFAAGGADVEHFPQPGRSGPAARRDRIAAELAGPLAELPKRQRQVVELFWFEELSDVAIGARLGCQPRTASVMRCRALRTLRTPTLLALLEEIHDG
jgi:RNA polymerase sigma factor (sigma-70 family)